MAEFQLPASSETGFVAAVGLKFDRIKEDDVAGHVELTEEHHTPWGVVHGGLYTTLVETAASVGASKAVFERGQYAVGVNNNTDFLRPAVRGRAFVHATAAHQGRTQQLWDVSITLEETGKLLARGQLRVQNVPLPESLPH